MQKGLQIGMQTSIAYMHYSEINIVGERRNNLWFKNILSSFIKFLTTLIFRLTDDILLDDLFSDDDDEEETVLKDNSNIDFNNPPNNALTNENGETLFGAKNNGICLDFSTTNTNTSFQNENWNEVRVYQFLFMK